MSKGKRYRWKMAEKETGLRTIGAAPRGYIYHNGEDVIARINPNGGGWQRKQDGWYWVANGDGIPLKNTCRESVATVEEAQVQAEAYVKGCLLLAEVVDRSAERTAGEFHVQQ